MGIQIDAGLPEGTTVVPFEHLAETYDRFSKNLIKCPPIAENHDLSSEEGRVIIFSSHAWMLGYAIPKRAFDFFDRLNACIAHWQLAFPGR